MDAVIFSPDGKHVASAAALSFKTTVKLWDLSTGAALQTIGTSTKKLKLSFSHGHLFPWGFIQASYSSTRVPLALFFTHLTSMTGRVLYISSQSLVLLKADRLLITP